MNKFAMLISVGMLLAANAGTAAGKEVCAADNTSVAANMQKYKVTNRPHKSKRLFTSKAVEAQIKRVKSMLTNPKLAWMFEN